MQDITDEDPVCEQACSSDSTHTRHHEVRRRLTGGPMQTRCQSIIENPPLTATAYLSMLSMTAQCGGATVATLTIRNLSDQTHRALKERASRHNRSMEAEVRAILEETVHQRRAPLSALLQEIRETTGGFDLELPPRTASRQVELE